MLGCIWLPGNCGVLGRPPGNGVLSVRYNTLFCYLFIYLFTFETGSHCIALAGLELGVYTRLASTPQVFTCLCLLRADVRSGKLHFEKRFKFIDIAEERQKATQGPK